MGGVARKKRTVSRQCTANARWQILRARDERCAAWAGRRGFAEGERRRSWAGRRADSGGAEGLSNRPGVLGAVAGAGLAAAVAAVAVVAAGRAQHAVYSTGRVESSQSGRRPVAKRAGGGDLWGLGTL
jgi:hypothetical protein